MNARKLNFHMHTGWGGSVVVAAAALVGFADIMPVDDTVDDTVDGVRLIALFGGRRLWNLQVLCLPICLGIRAPCHVMRSTECKPGGQGPQHRQ